MKTSKDYIQEIKNYCDFNIEYDTTNKIYKFNTISVDEINVTNFETEANILKYSLLTFLKKVEKKAEFLHTVLKELKTNLDWYNDEKIRSFSNFYSINKLTVNTVNETTKSNPRYSIDFIREFNGEINDKYDGIFYYLILNKSITQNYKDALDFERAKLHYIIVKYFDSLSNLQDTLISIVEDFKYYGIVNFDPAEIIDNVTRCNSKLGKFQTAYLIKILFDSKLFYYDNIDSDNNEKLMIQFLNKNFSYTRRDKKLEDIKNVNKELDMTDLVKDEDTLKKMKKVLLELQSIINSESSKLD